MDLIKTANEITIKVTSSKEEFVSILENKGFHEVERFILDDDYFVSKELDISKMSVREILSKAVLVRTCTGNSGERIFLSFKEKNIADDGTIISQKSTNCNVVKRDEAAQFLKAIGFRLLMNIRENDIVYGNSDIELVIKDIDGGDLLVEIEIDENSRIKTIEELIDYVKKLEFPIVEGEFFIKKAEIELEKKLRQ